MKKYVQLWLRRKQDEEEEKESYAFDHNNGEKIVAIGKRCLHGTSKRLLFTIFSIRFIAILCV